MKKIKLYVRIEAIYKVGGILLVPDLGFYVQKINQLVQDTEAVGEKMHPKYMIVREAIDENKVSDLSAEVLADIIQTFEAGTKEYEQMLNKLNGLRPPARILGLHKRLHAAYRNYVAGCQEMIASLQAEAMDVAAFNAAEKKQDEATDTIGSAIQRMTMLLLKR